jgi:hypothetical protein
MTYWAIFDPDEPDVNAFGWFSRDEAWGPKRHRKRFPTARGAFAMCRTLLALSEVRTPKVWRVTRKQRPKS